MRAAVSIICLALSAATAVAQPRPFTPALTCAAVKGIVARQGAVVLATSAHAYELVFLDSGACRGEVTAVPAFEPALDDPNCFAGYRCQQRNNGNTSGK
ncbi:hypothetical protein [Methylobacterium brachythecii]|uniref:Uncharacterized protein n=1 Tax=Methylobacterium brachythecii TaxID=1176177 RepID=A0A7W6F8I9_9HYPH|nr:hypothetical protein [Methylobacterium brachythecii]MBB3904146.1 hypothetical protein [Methylobacterium brachythecii]GLS42889.1 hypothetical protein GCM10007884_08740 [Methylobacterium brachythecii]